MSDDTTIEPLTEVITTNTASKTEWSFYDENLRPIHIAKRVYKKRPVVQVFPYSYNVERGLRKKKIQEIELDGWRKFKDIPALIRKGQTIKVTTGNIKMLMSFIYKQFPDVSKVKFAKNGRSRFTKHSVTFNWSAFEDIVKSISKEVRIYETRRKTTINNSLSKITSKLAPRKTKLSKGYISHYFSLYYDDISLSDSDLDSVLSLLALAPASKISVTDNYIQTKDKINIAYLDDIIKNYEALLKHAKDNEKEWQTFFEKHGWILSNLFPFQVVLHGREAYIGGKTLENKEGRVVDFLYQNGFRDNFALLEIKTHYRKLIKNTPYREPDVFAMHDHLSAAISQCLDQKNTFLTDFGQKYKILDPRVILVIGLKSKLNVNQSKCFELIRGNQQNVVMVTFDELLEKIKGLRSVLQI